MASSSTGKLEPFLLMAKSAKGVSASKLIENATAAPGVYVYAELLDVPNVKELSESPQFSGHLTLLQIFSYGTYADYRQNLSRLPKLNQAQLTKLKQLSIVSLANESRILPYSQLLAALDLPSIRVLEDLIIDAIYADIVRGKLDQKQQQFEVQYTMGRDLRPGQLEELLEALQDWSSRISFVLDALDGKIADIELNDARSKEILGDHDLIRQATVTEILSSRYGNNPNPVTAGAKRGDRERGPHLTQTQAVFDDMEVDPVSPSSPTGGVSSSQNTRKKPASSGASGGTNARKRVRGGP